MNDNLNIFDENSIFLPNNKTSKSDENYYIEIEKKITAFFRRNKNGLDNLVNKIIERYNALLIQKDSLKNSYQDLNNQVF